MKEKYKIFWEIAENLPTDELKEKFHYIIELMQIMMQIIDELGLKQEFNERLSKLNKNKKE